MTLDANCTYMWENRRRSLSCNLRGSASVSRDRRQYTDMIDRSDSFAEPELLQEDPIHMSTVTGMLRCDWTAALRGGVVQRHALAHLLPIPQLSVASIHLLMIKCGGDFLIIL